MFATMVVLEEETRVIVMPFRDTTGFVVSGMKFVPEIVIWFGAVA
jgi:hypothetical protein